MWTRELLKTNAKRVLQHNYWRTFLVCLAAGVLTGAYNNGEKVTEEIVAEGGGFLAGLAAVIVAILAIVIALVALGWGILGANVLQVGWKRYMMENRLGDAPFDTLFSGFHGSYWNIVKAMFFTNLKIVLYCLCFIVPGIIKAYEFYFVGYLLAENPDMEPARAQQLSTLMTDGEKWNIFILECSFFGWNMLSLVTFGISALFVSPYYEATMAELYAAMRAKAFALGYTDEQELGGFIQH
ncbi:MAG: DUF975 family protein [Faecalibacterium sp.]|nr:DUF975 family protein [Faecalibacterium sp.]